MLVHEILTATASRLPRKTALVCAGRRVTYSELDAMSDRLAAALIRRGVCRGDRVAVLLPNCTEAVVSIFGALKAGAVSVALPHVTKPDRLCAILNDCDAAALVTGGAAAAPGRLETIATRCPALGTIITVDAAAGTERTLAYESIQAEGAGRNRCAEAIDLDLAWLIYTSGSTGEPKGVMCDHSNVVFAANSIASYLRNTEEDVILNALPLSFTYGLYQAVTAFLAGATVVLENGFAYPATVLQRAVQERATGFPCVPTMFASLLRLDLAAFDLSSLRYMTNAAAALPPSDIAAIRARLPWVNLYSMYGLTETARALYLPPEMLDSRPASVGIAIPGTEVWIEGQDGSRLGPGAVGELVVRGRHVMRGYWNRPAETAKRFRPGPVPGERICHTGDLFRMDREGLMYFVARKDDMINTRGEKVAPREVENVLADIDGVFEAAVVGVPDPVLGAAVKAVLVADASRVTSALVLAHCRRELEEYKVPRVVEFRQDLPKTSSGKLLRRDLVEQVC